jgi:hypothetical protein
VEHIPPRQRNKILEGDLVPRILLEEREQEVLAKDEMVKVSGYSVHTLVARFVCGKIYNCCGVF